MARAARLFGSFGCSSSPSSVRDRVGDELFEVARGDFVEGFVDVQGGLDGGVSEPRLRQPGMGIGSLGKRIPNCYA